MPIRIGIWARARARGRARAGPGRARGGRARCRTTPRGVLRGGGGGGGRAARLRGAGGVGEGGGVPHPPSSAMEFELKRSAERLRSEQATRSAAQLARRDEVERRKAAARAAREAHEERQRARRLREAAAREEEALAAETSRAHNGGIALQARLHAVPGEAARERGIRRHTDKATLPARLGAALEAERATGGGASAWEVRVIATGARTHVTALDFSEKEDVVGLPPHVREQLGLEAGVRGGHAGDAAAAGGEDEPRPRLAVVEVAFRKLPKASHVTLRPLTSDFSKEVVNVRSELEGALAAHSTLTRGETLGVTVASTGKTYRIEVLSVAPETASHGVSVVETDVEVDIAPSREYEQAVERAEFERAQQAESAARAAEEEARRKAEDEAARVAAEESAARALTEARAALVGIASSADSDMAIDGDAECELLVDVVATGARVQLRVQRSMEVSAVIARVKQRAAATALEALDSGAGTEAQAAAVRAAEVLRAPLELVPALPGAAPLRSDDGHTLALAGVGRRERVIARAPTAP